MVLEVNNQYLALPSSQKPAGERPGRLLIEGIGMQEHHNTNVTAAQIRATINLFRAMSFTGSSEKIRLSVSELDILGQGWNDFGGSGTGHHTSSTVTNQGLLTQARLYGEYMALYLENSDLIERVSIWGISDNHSWRSRGLPLLFDHGGRAKPAYYRFVGALSN
jgi:endo-1,4-beta-xylanase